MNGVLIRDGEGGDLMTAEQFGDFELRLEWKITERRQQRHHVPRRHGRARIPGDTGPEFQILHNAGHKDGATDHVSRIELRDARAGERRHQAGRRVERRAA